MVAAQKGYSSIMYVLRDGIRQSMLWSSCASKSVNTLVKYEWRIYGRKYVEMEKPRLWNLD